MICIEFLGMSRGGKTTVKNKLLEDLIKEGLDVTSLERPMIPFMEFDSLYHFHDFLIDYLNRIIDANRDKDVLIIDRGPYDRKVLLDFDFEHLALSLEEYDSLKSKIRRFLPKINQGFVFMISPEESLRRWAEQRIKGLDLSHLNVGLNSGDDPRGLASLYQRYRELLKDSRMLLVDGLKSVEFNLEKIKNYLLHHVPYRRS